MNLAGSDYLLRLAALSLSFVGFSTIVVALRRALAGELSDRHIALVRLFIEGGLAVTEGGLAVTEGGLAVTEGGLAVTAFGLLPSVLSLLEVPNSGVWRLVSAAAGLTFSAYLMTQARRRRRVESGRLPLRVVINSSVSIIALAALWLNAAAIPFEPSVGPYALALTWFPFLSGLVFLQTLEVFLHRPPET